MRTTRKPALLVRIVAMVLILVSLIMLFLPWMKLNLRTPYGAVKLEQVAAMGGIDLRQSFMDEVVADLEEDAREYGIFLDRNKIMDAFDLVIKGKWSPFQLLGLAGKTRSFLKQYSQYLTAEENDYAQRWGYDDRDAVDARNQNQQIKGYRSSVSLFYFILLFVLILTLALSLLALYSAFRGKKLGLLPYLFSAAVLEIAVGIFAGTLNKNLIPLMELPASAGYSIKFALAVGGILCLVFGALAFGSLFAPVYEEGQERNAAGNWRCPRCGTMLQADQNFCLSCGAKRPESAPAPVAAAPLAAARGWKCPGCGASLKNSQNFCSKCGTKRPETAPAAAPAPRGWKCPGCGASLKNNQNFCPNCGGRRPEFTPGPAPVRAAAPAAAPSQTPLHPTVPGAVPVPPPAPVHPIAPAAAPIPAPTPVRPAAPVAAPTPAPAPASPVIPAAAPIPASAPARPVVPEKAPLAKGWKCPRCGTELKEGQKFCLNCGAKRPDAEPVPAPAAPSVQRCENCGTEMPAGLMFCPKCGTRAGSRPTAAPIPARPAAPAPAPSPISAPAAARPAPAAEAPKPVPSEEEKPTPALGDTIILSMENNPFRKKPDQDKAENRDV